MRKNSFQTSRPNRNLLNKLNHHLSTKNSLSKTLQLQFEESECSQLKLINCMSSPYFPPQCKQYLVTTN